MVPTVVSVLFIRKELNPQRITLAEDDAYICIHSTSLEDVLHKVKNNEYRV